MTKLCHSQQKSALPAAVKFSSQGQRSRSDVIKI